MERYRWLQHSSAWGMNVWYEPRAIHFLRWWRCEVNWNFPGLCLDRRSNLPCRSQWEIWASFCFSGGRFGKLWQVGSENSSLSIDGKGAWRIHQANSSYSSYSGYGVQSCTVFNEETVSTPHRPASPRRSGPTRSTSHTTHCTQNLQAEQRIPRFLMKSYEICFPISQKAICLTVT